MLVENNYQHYVKHFTNRLKRVVGNLSTKVIEAYRPYKSQSQRPFTLFWFFWVSAKNGVGEIAYSGNRYSAMGLIRHL